MIPIFPEKCPTCSSRLIEHLDCNSKGRDGKTCANNCGFGIWNVGWSGKKPKKPDNFFFFLGPGFTWDDIEMSIDDFQRRLKLESFE